MHRAHHLNHYPAILIGYDSVEELIRGHVAGEPFFMMPMTETLTNRIGMSVCRFFVFISDLRNGVGRYCRLPIASVQVTVGIPSCDETMASANALTLSAEVALRRYLVNLNAFEVERAALTRPEGLVMIDGHTSVITKVDPVTYVVSSDHSVTPFRRPAEPAEPQTAPDDGAVRVEIAELQ